MKPAKKVESTGKENGGNELHINGEKIALTKIEGRPDCLKRRNRFQGGFLNKEDDVWYTAIVDNVTFLLSNGSDVKISRVNPRGDNTIHAEHTLVFSESSFHAGYLAFTGNKSYYKVTLKAENVFHHDKSVLEESSIVCKDLRLYGDSNLEKAYLTVDNIYCANSDIRRTECQDFNALKIINGSLGRTNGIMVVATNHDAEGGDYVLDIKNTDMFGDSVTDMMPSVAGKYQISHRAHAGTFAGLSPVHFIRMEHDRMLLGSTVKVTKDDVIMELESLNKYQGESAGGHLRLWRVFANDRRAITEIPKEMVPQFKTFLKSILSRLELFSLLSTLNR